MSDGTPTPTETVPSGGGAGGPVGVRGTVRAISAGIGLLLAGLVVSIVFGVAFTVPLILFGGEISGTVSFLALAAVGQVAFLVVGVVYVRRVGGVTVRWPTRRDLLYTVGGLVTTRPSRRDGRSRPIHRHRASTAGGR